MARASAISLSSYTYSLSSALKIEESDGSQVCTPLRTPRDVRNFIKNPPAWRSLCVELKPHSEYAIRNMDIVRQSKTKKEFEIELTEPETFCHFNPAHEDVGRHKRKLLPKTLVCHDMANGYHDDCKIDGTFNFEAYTFYNWAVVDIFCYFSHHFVTIPPLGWINVGHEHGVKVIGTVVTEWAVGAQIWEALLASPKEWQEFATSLVTIAKTLKFDGWLLNIENTVKQPETLLQFVQHLHALLHKELEEPVLIWYDSVTTDGELLWQNSLNEKNKPFFDACDGIFTNYAWCENDIQASCDAAGSRQRDVFVGIDVWGRNFVGGGQFNTQEAMKIVHNNGCSVAIFAPAWTHEALDDEQSQISTVGRAGELEVLESFLLRERALWGSLWPFLHTKLPCTLPFQTSFCKGQGKKRRLYGEVLASGAWYNLRHQHYQPSAAHGPHAYVLGDARALRDLHARGPLRARGPAQLRAALRARAPPAPPAPPAQPAQPAAPADPAAPPTSERKRSLKDRFRDHVKKGLESLKKKKPIGDLRTDSMPEATASDPASSERELSFSLRLGRRPDSKHPALVYVATEAECLQVYAADSFTGGSCLALHPPDDADAGPRLTRLFHCDFEINGILVACVVTKVLPEAREQFLDVVVCVREEAGPERRLLLAGREAARGLAALAPAEPQFKSLQSYLLLREPAFYVSVQNAYDWNVRYYEAHAQGRVTSINCCLGDASGPILLGHLGLCQRHGVEKM